MKTVALIPARGGSKRLPRKNILPFQGKPMIAHTIEAALQSGLFEKVVVSTDDPEINEISKKYDAHVLMRDPSLATDQASVRAVALDFLEREKEVELLCVLYATAPMRSAADIRATHALIERGVCHHALAVCEYSHSPHQALKVMSDKGDISPMWPELVALRSDAVPKMVVDNGSTYFVVVEDFKKDSNFYAPAMRGHVMPRWKSVDMDTADDFDLAQFYAGKYWSQR
jgi:pseudaminic acid cytidylyltransferase